ncbi:MAG: hypothetical protein ACW99A_13765 [Candidatus Kariarchaeaceae archaeon]|jgi:uncharacterized protein (UPF0335 family)
MGILKAQIKSVTKEELSKLIVDENVEIILQAIERTEDGKFSADVFFNGDQVEDLKKKGFDIKISQPIPHQN